jgi:ATP phosphoribosyltransferase
MKVESGEDIVAVHAVIDSERVFSTVNRLREAGASGILIMPIERMIP